MKNLPAIFFLGLLCLGLPTWAHGEPQKQMRKMLTLVPKMLTLDGPLTTKSVAGPKWARNQPIYEVNLDKYGFAQGTALREYEARLPVLKEMGIGIVWFMPTYPRGEKRAFGSPYAVRDYRGVNANLGTPEEFRHLVKRAHALGLHVLLDWVPNHTSWDNAWIETHPEYYVKNDAGEIQQANEWADVAQLDYGTPNHWNMALWKEMRDAMQFWVRDSGIDGFRCDVAGRGGRVPQEFWDWLRPQLEAVKPLLMLAEADDARLHPAFDMTYSWDLPPVLWDICAGKKPATAIDTLLETEAKTFPPGAVLMRFLDNHDWHPHADWGWGDRPAIDTAGGMPQVAPLMVLCATLPGKPLLYNGQELSFTKTDPSPDISRVRRAPVFPFYRRLLTLFQSQPAVSDGTFSRIATGDDAFLYAFTRRKGASRVLVVVNLSGTARTATLAGDALAGTYRDGFAARTVTLPAHAVTLSPTSTLALPPWGYRVYVAASPASR